jgi:hypothetical protein
VIGATYTKAMGLKPGDEFEIRLGYKHIHLIQLSESEKQLIQSDDDADADESDAEE